MNDFVLHERLARDCHLVGDLDLCRVLLMDDARFPWLILVPRRAAIIEVFQLADAEQRRLWQEVTAVGEALLVENSAHKLNVAALGNMVPQLHVHVIARFREDAAWPGPVWGVGKRQPYTEDELGEVLVRARMLLADLAGV